MLYTILKRIYLRLSANAIMLLCFLFSALQSNAQQDDFGIWTTINIEKKLNSRFSGTITEELRFMDNASMLTTAYTNISLNYKIAKGFNVSGNYRFINRRQPEGYYSIRHRLFADLSYRFKTEDFSATFRTRIQSQFEKAFAEQRENITEWYWRNKLTLRYAIKKYKPFTSFEVYYPLNNPQFESVDNIRLAAGCAYSINKRNDIEGYYLINRELYGNNPVTSYVVGVEYTYSF